MSNTNRHSRFTVILFGLLVALIALRVVLGFPEERSRWHVASALELSLDGNLEDAVVQLERAIELSPDNLRLQILKASWTSRLEIDRLGKLQCDGFHDEALSKWNRMLENARLEYEQASPVTKTRKAEVYAIMLNGRAYARAQANRDVEEGLADMELAFKLLGTDKDAAMLDTRGYLHLLAGNLDLARDDMDRAVSLAERRYASENRRAKVSGKQAIDLRQIENRLVALRQQLAVLYYHRAEVYEALGDMDRAERDFRRADEFGYDPDSGVC